MSGKASTRPYVSANIHRELDRQQTVIYQAQAILECVVTKYESHFESWPARVPLIGYALRVVIAHLESAAIALYNEELLAAAAKPDILADREDRLSPPAFKLALPLPARTFLARPIIEPRQVLLFPGETDI